MYKLFLNKKQRKQTKYTNGEKFELKQLSILE